MELKNFYVVIEEIFLELTNFGNAITFRRNDDTCSINELHGPLCLNFTVIFCNFIIFSVFINVAIATDTYAQIVVVFG